AEEKRLFAGLWTNTCCSHPLPEESAEEAGMRRLQEEMGFSCPLHTAGSFVYRAEDPHGNGAEHEYDTVLIGIVDDTDVHAHPAEVSDWKWIHIDDLTEELERRPDLFTPWFAQGLAIAIRYFHQNTEWQHSAIAKTSSP
ncbi:NUDIX domain-containing protein, partial [Candidatus Peregrinibacteria bacterium]|nr:NUDIX domain-containing protein [Candidatus Peregrinibacteria bacterium]